MIFQKHAPHFDGWMDDTQQLLIKCSKSRLQSCAPKYMKLGSTKLLFDTCS